MDNNVGKNNKKKPFVILIFLVLVVGVAVIYMVYNKMEIKKENVDEIKNVKENNYIAEDTSIIDVLNVSIKLNRNNKYDSFFDNSVFIGGNFLNLYNEFRKEKKILENIEIVANDDIKISDLKNNKGSINLDQILENKSKVFLMLGINDLNDDKVFDVIKDYVDLIESINKEVDVYVINEVYYNKTDEDKFIKNSIIREFNYKLKKLRADLDFEFINFSHAIINSAGYVTTLFYEKETYKEEAFNVFTNILRDLASYNISKELMVSANKSLNTCRNSLEYEECNKAKELIYKLKDGTEKDTYLKEINSLFDELEKKFSLDLSDITISGKKITVTNNTDYYYTVNSSTSEVKVGAKAVSENAKISGIDFYSLINGNNLVRLTVENAGKTKVYSINIKRDADTKINKVLIDNKEIDINTLIAEIDKDVRRIELKIIANDKNAVIKGDGRLDIREDDTHIGFSVNGFNYSIILEKK